ncbi:MAG TPA: glycosyltransferase family A protein [Nocardioidaceae bacterium]|nr:glycosyltransferase family A protein [Nocardioidaceae bacterium]
MTQRPAHVVYIAGSGRSGSTLIERGLGAIPRWVNVGELIELFRKPSVAAELCGCGEAFAECPFWGEVGARVFGSWASDTIAHVGHLQRQVSRQRFLPRLLLTGDDSASEFADTVREYGAVYDSLYAAVADVADADVVVDASKWPGQALALRRAVTPEMSLLHLVRDPRGVAYSWAKTQVRRPHGGDADSVMATHPSIETARRWAAFQSEIALIRRAFDHSTRLRYEDFVVDPHGRLATTLRELGLGEYADQLGHIHRDRIELPQSHGVAGNPSRFAHGVVALRADEAWRTAFPEKDRRRVTAITAPWLARYGYPIRSEPAPAADAAPVSAIADATEWPTVCVVLPTRGRPELLREAVESVIAQDYAGAIDVIVVHDHEEQQTELKALEGDGRTVTLLNNTHAEGLAGARNTGLDNTDAEFIASCDDDDFWDEDKLRLQMTRMLAEPDLSVLGAGIRLLMGEDHVVEWPGDSPDVTRAQLLRSRRKELHSSTLLMRRRVFDEVGGYDETLPMSYAEDYEFLLRAVETGRIGVVNMPLASIRKYRPEDALATGGAVGPLRRQDPPRRFGLRE